MNVYPGRTSAFADRSEPSFPQLEGAHSFPLLESPEWCARAVVPFHEQTKVENASAVILSRTPPTSSGKTKAQAKTFTRSPGVPPKKRAQPEDNLNTTNVSHFEFSEPQAAKKADAKTAEQKTANKSPAPQDTKPQSSFVFGFAFKIYTLIVDILFSNFYSSDKTKEPKKATTSATETANQKPSFVKETPKAENASTVPKSPPKTEKPKAKGAKDNAPAQKAANVQAPEPQRAKQSASFTEKTKPKETNPKEVKKDAAPKAAPKTKANDSKPIPKPTANAHTEYSKANQIPSFSRIPKPEALPNRPPFSRFYHPPLHSFGTSFSALHALRRATSINPSTIAQMTSVPQEIREHASFKNDQPFRRLVILYDRLDGKLKGDTTPLDAQEQLKVIFKVDSFAEAKKKYNGLRKLIHPDKAKLQGLKEEQSQAYLSKLFVFCNAYYSLAIK